MKAEILKIETKTKTLKIRPQEWHLETRYLTSATNILKHYWRHVCLT